MTRIGVLAALMVALLWTLSLSAQVRPNSLSGCLVLHAGQYELGAVPSGYTYVLRGNTAGLYKYEHYLVRLTGAAATPANSNQQGTFNVQGVSVLGDSCTTPVPPQIRQAVRPVTGKTGQVANDINTSTTASVTEITPGAQTGAGMVQQPSEHAEVEPGEVNRIPERGLLAPPNWGQVGEAPQEGNLDAAAAQRAEETPSATLGVNATPSQANAKAPSGKH